MSKFFVLILFLISLPAAATHHCIGNVNNISVSGNGDVYVGISSIGDSNVICNAGGTKGEFNQEACKTAISMILSAKMAQKKIRLYFKNDENTSCTKGNWNDFSTSGHQLYFIELTN
ncbi:MAG: hypothetical protein ACI8SR_000512 [Oceanicoccus sp.]|jgi:hypothetical protein